MVDIWLRLVVRIEGNKITKAILLPKKLSDPAAVLELFSKIGTLVSEDRKVMKESKK